MKAAQEIFAKARQYPRIYGNIKNIQNDVYNIGYLLSHEQIQAAALLQISEKLNISIAQAARDYFIDGMNVDPESSLNITLMENFFSESIENAVGAAKQGKPAFISLDDGRHFALVALVPERNSPHVLSLIYANSLPANVPDYKANPLVNTGKKFTNVLLQYIEANKSKFGIELAHQNMLDMSRDQQIGNCCGLSVASNIAGVAAHIAQGKPVVTIKDSFFIPNNSKEKHIYYQLFGKELFIALDDGALDFNTPYVSKARPAQVMDLEFNKGFDPLYIPVLKALESGNLELASYKISELQISVDAINPDNKGLCRVLEEIARAAGGIEKTPTLIQRYSETIRTIEEKRILAGAGTNGGGELDGSDALFTPNNGREKQNYHQSLGKGTFIGSGDMSLDSKALYANKRVQNPLVVTSSNDFDPYALAQAMLDAKDVEAAIDIIKELQIPADQIRLGDHKLVVILERIKEFAGDKTPEFITSYLSIIVSIKRKNEQGSSEVLGKATGNINARLANINHNYYIRSEAMAIYYNAIRALRQFLDVQLKKGQFDKQIAVEAWNEILSQADTKVQLLIAGKTEAWEEQAKKQAAEQVNEVARLAELNDIRYRIEEEIRNSIEVNFVHQWYGEKSRDIFNSALLEAGHKAEKAVKHYRDGLRYKVIKGIYDFAIEQAVDKVKEQFIVAEVESAIKSSTNAAILKVLGAMQDTISRQCKGDN